MNPRHGTLLGGDLDAFIEHLACECEARCECEEMNLPEGEVEWREDWLPEGKG